ncbi:hypothetical protein [uncultured Microscilla sp.]|uniref:hypothetical protein n=1 Tax=uncultured Microscilla sp. TaxID=432653 RepID=UPI00262657A5|nr:hypothetical protein [uncultured Microscilla sp.]
MIQHFFSVVLSVCLFNPATVKDDCTQVAGIKIWKETMVFAKDDGFPYCELLQQAVNKDQKSIRRLAFKTFDASAGLGHGTVIVALVHKIGEETFVKAIKKLSPQNKKDVLLNLQAGLAYTSIKKYHEKPVKDVFPELARLLH